MLKNLSTISSDLLIHNNPALITKRNVYIYGFQIIYSTVFCTFSIFILGLLLNQVFLTMIFLSIFSFGRVLAGGYHASTYGKCYILTMVCYISTQVLTFFLTNRIILQAGLFLLSIIYVGIKGPIYSSNKRVRSELIYHHQKNLKVYLIIISIVFILILNQSMYNISSQISSTLFMVTLLFYIQQRRSYYDQCNC